MLELALTVVVGVSTIEGTTTEVLRIAPDGAHETLLTIDHARGRLPKGVLAGDRLVTVTVVDDALGTVVEEAHLATGARKVIASGAVATQAPFVDGTDVLFVRTDPGERVFELVKNGTVVQREVGATWMGIVDGRALVHRGAAWILDGKTIATGAIRSVTPTGAFERALPKGRAEIVVDGRVVHEGLAGMDPLALPDGRLAFGAGTKAARVIVGDKGTVLDAGRAGIATPKAAALVDGVPIVVAWIDRGAALPGELWLLTTRGAARLLDPAPGVAVEVYGVVEVAR